MKFTLKAVNYKSISKNTLKGSVDLITPGGMRLKGVLWHESHEREWVSPPAIPWTDDAGKKQWRAIIDWETPEAREAFQLAALDAIHGLLGKAMAKEGESSSAGSFL